MVVVRVFHFDVAMNEIQVDIREVVQNSVVDNFRSFTTFRSSWPTNVLITNDNGIYLHVGAIVNFRVTQVEVIVHGIE